MQAHIYLNFPGQCKQAFDQYRKIFGGEFETFMRYDEGPDDFQMSPGQEEWVMHVSLPLGNTILMGSDAPQAKPGSNVYISVSPDSRAEADQIFAQLSEGGKVEMPMADMFWGDYFGSLEDRFGVKWMVNVAGDVA